MTDGQVVRLDDGALAELKRVVVQGSFQTVLVAVERPAPRPAIKAS